MFSTNGSINKNEYAEQIFIKQENEADEHEVSIKQEPLLWDESNSVLDAKVGQIF